jgi:hypothetical protein
VIKNTASQKVGAQMVSATDGSAFTGSVTVSVTVDAGTQATGTVGSGACTHEGNGYHTYAPSQAETNGDLVAFTFTGTGAVPQTVQVYTRGGLSTQEKADVNTEADTAASDYGALKPTTAGRTLDVSAGGEAGLDWANIGSPTTAVNLSGTNIDVDQVVGSVAAGGITASSLAADAITAAKIAADVSAEIADAVWEEDLSDHSGTVGSVAEALNAAGSAGDPWTTALPGAYGSGSAGKIIGDNINATISSRATQASVDTVDDFLDTEVAAIKAKTDQLTFTTANRVDSTTQAGLSTLDAAGVRTAVGLASANLDTQLDALPTNAELATALGTADDAVLAAIAALNNLSQANIRTAVGLASANLDTQLTAIDDLLDTEVAAIKTVVDAIAAAQFTANAGADALLDRANGIETGLTLRGAMRLIAASSAGKLSGAATSTVTIRNIGDSKDRITATVDADGNRAAVTTDAT